MPQDDLSPAIAVLERQLADHERKGNEIRAAINVLYTSSGRPPKYTEAEMTASGQGGGATLTQIKRDSFYGKKQMTAIREYLEMRRAQGDGPATPREILDALKAGGYKFEAKSEGVALVGLRALLRKATSVFHKLPGTGTYGLLAWYPNAKPGRADDENTGSKAVKRKKGRPRKSDESAASPEGKEDAA